MRRSSRGPRGGGRGLGAPGEHERPPARVRGGGRLAGGTRWRRSRSSSALALAAVLAASLVAPAAAPSGALADPVTVKRALSSTAALFGDPVEAEVDVVSRMRTCPRGSVRVGTSFAPFTVVSRKVDRAHVGGASLLRTTVTLQCLTRACLPPARRAPRPVPADRRQLREGGTPGADRRSPGSRSRSPRGCRRARPGSA